MGTTPRASVRNNQQRYSLSATWRAMRSIATDHFPQILPHVHPIAAWFILRQLKRRGYSNVRAVASPSGLVVHAQR